MQEIVINRCNGGFSLSSEAVARLKELSMGNRCQCGHVCGLGAVRDDPRLVQVVRELGPAASGVVSRLGIIEVPDGVEWVIMQYDGYEWVAEEHRTWGEDQCKRS